MASCKFFHIVVIALLFSCSVVCRRAFRLISRQRQYICRQQNPKYLDLDAYIQIECHGNEQSCNATCDGASSGNRNTRLKIFERNGKKCIQALSDPTYVLKVNNATQDLIFERGHSCKNESFFLFKETRNSSRFGIYHSYSHQLNGHGMRLECSCDDNRLTLNRTTESSSWFHRRIMKNGLKICKNETNEKVCIQSLNDPTYVLKVNATTQDLIFERGHSCEEGEFFLFREAKTPDRRNLVLYHNYSYQSSGHESQKRLKFSCHDNRLRLREFDISPEGNHGLFSEERL